MIDAHENTNLTLQTRLDLGTESALLVDDLDGINDSCSSVRCSKHRGKVSRTQLRSTLVLTVECLLKEEGIYPYV